MQGVEGGEGNGAVANPGLAYGGAYQAAHEGALGASAFSPSTGSYAGAAGTTQPGAIGLQTVLSHNGKDANSMQNDDNDGIQHGLALPFVPVALVFKDVHYYVKHRGGSGELQLLKASFATFPTSAFVNKLT